MLSPVTTALPFGEVVAGACEGGFVDLLCVPLPLLAPSSGNLEPRRRFMAAFDVHGPS